MFPIAISPMSVLELQNTFESRWMVAGGKDAPPFDAEAYKAIYAYTKGLPRDAIKLCDEALCDEALRDLCVRERTRASADDIATIAQELNLEV
jgi:hypothetical protein